MIRKELKLEGQERLQSRPAALLVQEACKYNARILIEQGGKTVNVKSMMGVLSLGQPLDEKLVLIVDGDDESKAAEAIEPMIGQMFAKA